MGATPEEVAAGHAFYTRRSLAVYDLAILGWFSQMAWRCPKSRILRHYDAQVSRNHLDVGVGVGVGSGFFLDRCRFPAAAPRVALLDVSEACLHKAGERIERYCPEVYRADVLQPIRLHTARFDSVSLNYVLHCLPGTMAAKAQAFVHLKALTNPGARVFGATLLHDGVHRTWFARRVMERNNRHGVFSNEGDSLEALQRVLSEHLEEPELEVVGCVGIFSGRV